MDSEFIYNIILLMYGPPDNTEPWVISLWKAVMLKAWVDLIVLKNNYKESVYWETAKDFLGSDKKKWKDFRHFVEDTIGRKPGETKRIYDMFVSDKNFRSKFIKELLKADVKRVFVDEFESIDLKKVIDEF